MTEPQMEWQPAIIRLEHNLYDQRNVVLNGKRVRVLETDPNLTWRVLVDGCVRDRKFRIHPEDVASLCPWHSGRPLAICEHEILTD